jgi:hypothetical protein
VNTQADELIFEEEEEEVSINWKNIFLVAIAIGLLVIAGFWAYRQFGPGSNEDPEPQVVISTNVSAGIKSLFIASVYTRPLEVSPALIKGSLVSNYLANIYTKKLLPKTTGAEKSLVIARQFTTEQYQVLQPNFQVIELIADLDRALAINVTEEIRAKADRGQALQQIVTQLTELQKKGEQAQANLVLKNQKLESDIAELNNDAESFEESFDLAFEERLSEDSERIYGQFVAAAEERSEKRAELGVVNSLLADLNPNLEATANRLDLIEANRRALILGVDCDCF